MRKYLFMIIAVLAMIGCKSKNEPAASVSRDDDTDGVAVQFNVLGLDLSHGSLSPRREETPEDAGITELWIIEDTVTLCHQLATDTDFGSPVVSLRSGQHTLTFIGSGRTGQQVVRGEWSADKWSDTYGCVHHVNVQSGMAAQNVVLSHANYVIAWSSTDVVPNSAVTAEIEIVGHRSTLLAGLNGGSVNPSYVFTANVTSKVGQALTMSVSGFCESYGIEENVTTNYTVRDKDGAVLFSHTKEVPVLGNRKTIVTGALFGSTKSSVKVNKDWLDDYEVTL